LAQRAVDVDADIIVMAGVHFMAETGQVAEPRSRTVLIPDCRGGLLAGRPRSPRRTSVCDAGSSYPGVPVVTYVNTSVRR
jgi:quinolinate synthase